MTVDDCGYPLVKCPIALTTQSGNWGGVRVESRLSHSLEGYDQIPLSPEAFNLPEENC